MSEFPIPLTVYTKKALPFGKALAVDSMEHKIDK